MSHVIFYMLVRFHTYIHQYNKTTIRIVNCNAIIHFNQECIKNSIIPQYAKLQIPHTSWSIYIRQWKGMVVTDCPSSTNPLPLPNLCITMGCDMNNARSDLCTSPFCASYQKTEINSQYTENCLDLIDSTSLKMLQSKSQISNFVTCIFSIFVFSVYLIGYSYQYCVYQTQRFLVKRHVP